MKPTGEADGDDRDIHSVRIRNRLIGGGFAFLLVLALVPMLFDGDGVHPDLRLQPDVGAGQRPGTPEIDIEAVPGTLPDSAVDGISGAGRKPVAQTPAGASPGTSSSVSPSAAPQSAPKTAPRTPPRVRPAAEDWRDEDWTFAGIGEEINAAAESDSTPAGRVVLFPEGAGQPSSTSGSPPGSGGSSSASPDQGLSQPRAATTTANSGDSKRTGWAVQVGAFRSADRARKLRDKLAKAGLNVMLSEGRNDQGLPIVRVATGPHVSRAEAALAASRLREQHGQEKPIVVRITL